jgi:hypothetical protein
MFNSEHVQCLSEDGGDLGMEFRWEALTEEIRLGKRKTGWAPPLTVCSVERGHDQVWKLKEAVLW